MRILLTPIGSAGDTFPFIGMGEELRRRGHDVAVATSGAFQPLVESLGMEYVEIGTAEEYQRHAGRAELFHPTRGVKYVMGVMSEYMRRLFDIIEQRRAGGPMLVVAHSLDFASRIWQDKLGSGPDGLPVVRIHLQPSILRSLHEMPVMKGTTDMTRWPRVLKRLFWWAADALVIDRAIAGEINALRRRVGLAPVSHVFESQMHSPLLTVGMFPDWFAAPQPDWPANVRLTGFPLYDVAGVQPVPEEVERLLDSGDPPIVFTPGSAFQFGHAFFDAAVGACERLERRGMLLTRHRGHVPDRLPASVAHFDFAPLSRILPRCGALVHHGGIGTSAAGLAGGVPQVIMPMSHDQPDNAARIRRLGVGDRLMPRQFTADALAGVLRPLLDSPVVTARCAELSGRCHQIDAIAGTCDLVESVAPLKAATLG